MIDRPRAGAAQMIPALHAPRHPKLFPGFGLGTRGPRGAALPGAAARKRNFASAAVPRRSLSTRGITRGVMSTLLPASRQRSAGPGDLRSAPPPLGSKTSAERGEAELRTEWKGAVQQPPVGQAQPDLLTDLITYSKGGHCPKKSVAHQFARKIEKRDFDGQHPGGGAVAKAKRRFALRALLS
jgi:hypothetical protein